MSSMPHKIVLETIEKSWEYKRSKRLLTKILEFGEIRAHADIIIEMEHYDEEHRRTTGRILNKWKYDKSGLQKIAVEEDYTGQQVDYCYYCFDRQKKLLVIDWFTIFPGNSTRKKLEYTGRGVTFEIIEKDGEEDYKIIRTWIE